MRQLSSRRLDVAGEPRALLLLAAEQRDALAVLAQARQRIAKLGLALVLHLGDAHEAPADDQHRAGAEHRIEEGGDDQKARDVELRAAKLEIERAADRPEHEDERHRGQERRQNAGDDVDRRFGGVADVVGDPALRILVVALDQVEMVVAAVVEPAVEHVVGQPLAPQALHRHLHVDVGDGEEHAAEQQRDVDHRLTQHFRRVLLLERIEQRRFQTFIWYWKNSVARMIARIAPVRIQARRSPSRLQKPGARRQKRRISCLRDDVVGLEVDLCARCRLRRQRP